MLFSHFLRAVRRFLSEPPFRLHGAIRISFAFIPSLPRHSLHLSRRRSRPRAYRNAPELVDLAPLCVHTGVRMPWVMQQPSSAGLQPHERWVVVAESEFFLWYQKVAHTHLEGGSPPLPRPELVCTCSVTYAPRRVVSPPKPIDIRRATSGWDTYRRSSAAVPTSTSNTTSSSTTSSSSASWKKKSSVSGRSCRACLLASLARIRYRIVEPTITGFVIATSEGRDESQQQWDYLLASVEPLLRITRQHAAAFEGSAAAASLSLRDCLLMKLMALVRSGTSLVAHRYVASSRESVRSLLLTLAISLQPPRRG